MSESRLDQLLGVDLRALSLSLRQGGSLLRALAGTTLANALQMPQTHKRRGKTAVAGLDAPVEIIRDRFDIPHCFAESSADALFALGYVQAQDRLWQMQWSRRAAMGRLAEIAGPAALPADRLLSNIGHRSRFGARLGRDTNQTTRPALPLHRRHQRGDRPSAATFRSANVGRPDRAVVARRQRRLGQTAVDSALARLGAAVDPCANRRGCRA